MLATQSLLKDNFVPPAYVTALGGDVAIVTVGDYKYHVFTSSKTSGSDGFNVSDAGNADGSDTVEYLVVAGGGAGVPYAGSHGTGGGGGAGGYRTGTGLSVSVQNYDITIGAGGTAAQSSATGDSGDDSIIEGLITATGGGGAGRSLTGTVAEMSGSVGGSGGGASGTGVASLGGVGIYDGDTIGSATWQGRDGGDVYPGGYQYGNGGGGGATTEGGDGNSVGGGDGGAGVQNLIASTSYGVSGYYCGGGGGASYSTGTYGSGGSGGGGAASSSNAAHGTSNTGGGGGGQGTGAGGNAGSGGSGIVIVKYKFQN